MQVGFPPYQPSPSRTVALAQAAGVATRAAVAAILPARLPAKAAGDTLDYPVDLDAWLAEIGDAIVSADAAVSRADAAALGPQDLGIVWLTLLGGRPVLALSGGLAGVVYQVALTVRTAQGRQARFPLSQALAAWDPAATPAPPALAPNNPCLDDGRWLRLDDGRPLVIA